MPLANAKIMARLIPNARLHVFEDGHLGLLTSADILAPVVSQFLTENEVPQVWAATGRIARFEGDTNGANGG